MGFVVDSSSTNSTVEIARNRGDEVPLNPWIKLATQMNWGIDRVPSGSDRIPRLDPDEVITPEFTSEIVERLLQLGFEIDGAIFRAA